VLAVLLAVRVGFAVAKRMGTKRVAVAGRV
jgi:hypothetical protein